MAEEPWYNAIVVMLTGMSVPLGSVERMYREVELPHLELVRFLEGLQQAVAGMAGATVAGSSGEWPREYVRAMSTFVSGDGADHIESLKSVAAQLAEAAHEFAYQIDYTHLLIVEQVFQFLAQLSVILLMEIYNPLQAEFEKLELFSFFGAVFRSELLLLLAREAAQATLVMALNTVLATAQDGLTRWLLALRGEHTSQGAAYRRQSAKFGAIQGAVSAVVPFVLGPVGKFFGKLVLGPKALKNVEEVIEGALHGSTPTGPARGAGKAFAPEGSDKAAESAGRPGRSVGPSLIKAEADGLGRELARLVVPMAIRLGNEVVRPGAREEFRRAVGQQFARVFAGQAVRESGGRLGRREALLAGRRWADAFMAAAGRRPDALARELGKTLGWMPGHLDGVRTALSSGVAGALPAHAGMKLVRLLPETALNAGAMNLAEGFFYLSETGTFTTSALTTAGGAGATALHGAGHVLAVGAGHWFKERLGLGMALDKSPLTGLDLRPVNPDAGNGAPPSPGDGRSGPGGDSNGSAATAAPYGRGGTVPPSEVWSAGGTLPAVGGEVRLDIPARLFSGVTTSVVPEAARPGGRDGSGGAPPVEPHASVAPSGETYRRAGQDRGAGSSAEEAAFPRPVTAHEPPTDSGTAGTTGAGKRPSHGILTVSDARAEATRRDPDDDPPPRFRADRAADGTDALSDSGTLADDTLTDADLHSETGTLADVAPPRAITADTPGGPGRAGTVGEYGPKKPVPGPPRDAADVRAWLAGLPGKGHTFPLRPEDRVVQVYAVHGTEPAPAPSEPAAAPAPASPLLETTLAHTPPHPPSDPPTLTLTPPDDDPARLTDAVTYFGTRHDGAQDLANITPVPQHVVEWLQDRVIRLVDDGPRPAPAFREAVRATLTARLLSAEWSRLLSASGLPLDVVHQGQRYPVSLRLGLSVLGPSPEQLAPLPDGPPVGIQRWAFGIAETGDTAGSGDLRTANATYGHTWGTGDGPLRHLTLTPQVSVTYNQLTTSVTVGRTVQSMALLRSRGRSWPYDYAMAWELRRNTGSVAEVLGGEPRSGWVAAGATPGRPDAPDDPPPLTVWFPSYLAKPEPKVAVDLGSPDPPPAPLTRLLDELPLLGPVTLVDHEALFADVLAAFPAHLRDLSDRSLTELYGFFQEGNLRSNLSLSWDGSMASPTLYSRNGTVIGYLRLATELSGGETLTGPTTANSVLESYVLRSLRMQGSSQISNALGVTLPLRMSLSLGGPDPVTGAEPLGGSVSLQVGGRHQFAHTLASGGSARIAHSLRTAKPLLHVTPEVRVHVTLIAPDRQPSAPAGGSRLVAGEPYRAALLVPSLPTLGHEPAETRHLPPELLHLRQLGVSVTPLRVQGTGPLFDRAEHWLREHGFLPSDLPSPGLWEGVTEETVRTQRLNNLRKLDLMRSGTGLRSALDEMIEGGDAVVFERPTAHGTRRVTVRLVAERRYTGARDDDGVVHERTLPDVQTLNYVGSTISGDEQFQSTPFAWTASAGASVTNPLSRGGDAPVQELGLRYTHSRQVSRTTGSSAGTGHEYYLLSPTSDGSQVFSVPVTYRMVVSDSHGPGLSPDPQEGTVRLAVPTYRTLAAPTAGARPPASTIRGVREADTHLLALPSAGHTYHDGVLRLPETALLDRVPGSAELRDLVPLMLDEIDRKAALRDELAWRNRAPMPGAFPDGIELEARPGDRPSGITTAADRQNDSVRPQASPPAPVRAPEPASAPGGGLGHLLAGAAEWVAGSVSGPWRLLWRTAVGEAATDPASTAREVVDTALSPHHLAANALRVFRDAYVVESAGTPGVVAGTDVVIEVRGYLTDVELLPQGPAMDAERWLQSTDASATTETATAVHQGSVTLSGRYGDRTSLSPSGDYTHGRTTSDSTTVNDNTGVFRVTTEDTTEVYRFTARPHLVVTVSRGRRNFLSGTLDPDPGLSSTKVVEPGLPLEFLVVDNDLHNHPDLARIVHDAGRHPKAVRSADQPLPPWFVAGGGTLGFGAVSEVHLPRREGFAERIRALVEREAPGATRPGHATYVPGVLTRINEHATSLGLRALVNAGPRGHTAFHFVHRSWLGPRLVEVALVARPARGVALAGVRGRLVTGTSGLDNVFGHSNGEGAALAVPGATRVSRSRGDSHELAFSAALAHNGHRARPALGLARRANWLDARLSSRETRAWQRTFGNTSEFRLPYDYEVRVRSWTLDDALAGRLLGTIGEGLGRLAQGLLPSAGPDPVAGHLPNASTGFRQSERADVVLRFNSAESAGHSPALTDGPGLFRSDPAEPPDAPPSPGDAVVDMDVPPDVRTALAGPVWTPGRPFEIYDFAGADLLGEALRAVDPSLVPDLSPRTTRSAEGVFIRLTTLAAAGRLTLLEPAAMAPHLGHPGGRGTSVRVTLYSPRIEVTGKDTAIDRIELSADGFQTQADTVIAPSVTFEYTAGGTDRGGVAVPLAGERASLGQTGLTSSQRRELLRFGTPMANSRGEGLDGHRVCAVALVEVRGPRGTRWVTGDVLFRTTETPPGGDRAEAMEPVGEADAPEPVGEDVPDAPATTDQVPDGTASLLPPVPVPTLAQQTFAIMAPASKPPDEPLGPVGFTGPHPPPGRAARVPRGVLPATPPRQR